MHFHLVAHAVRQTHPLGQPILAWALWHQLRPHFPEALAACLMPNHVHLLVESTSDARPQISKLAHVLAAFARRRLGGGHQWDAVEVVPVRGRDELRRQIRYIHLNPCRAKLVDDPLRWPWSTHRGAIGGEYDPWVRPDRLARALGRDTADFATWLHEYVSSDPAVAVAGTELVTPPPSRDVPIVALATVLAAAVAATPWAALGLRGLRRHAIVLLAWHQGWTEARLVASAARAGADWMRRLARQPNPSLLRPALLCLADARLRFPRETALPLLHTPSSEVDETALRRDAASRIRLVG